MNHFRRVRTGELCTELVQRTLKTVHRIYIDRTGVGEFFVEQAAKEELKHVKGIMLSLPEKENIMGLLKRTMEKGELKIPYDSELINEINVERYEQTQTGQTKVSSKSSILADL